MREGIARPHLPFDEFAAMLPATPPECATRLAERILAAVRTAPIVTAPGRLELVRVSIGIAGLDPAALVTDMVTSQSWGY